MDAITRPDDSVDLALEGMTCAACATRIEKVLNRLPGTRAAVNFATESAAVRHDPATTPVTALLDAVERAGYQVLTHRVSVPLSRRLAVAAPAARRARAARRASRREPSPASA